MNKELKSSYLKQFIREITYNNRNPKDIKALELLDEIETNPEIHYNNGDKLYRARIVKDRDDINKAIDFYGYNAKESFVPPREKTRDMRANYRYIPYLYCSNYPYLAMAEVRPRLGALVSIATIAINDRLCLLDFTNSNKPLKMSAAKENLFSDLSGLFSKPIADEDDIKEYIPTQFIAEYAKKLNYDGIVYRSSVVPEINQDGLDRYNIVVFNYQKCEAVKSNVFQITRNHLECIQRDSDVIRMTIMPYPEERLKEI